MYTKSTVKPLLMLAIGACIAGFGIINIHQVANITEGGVLGLILLLNHWFQLNPAFLSLVLDTLCYIAAYPFLGWAFIRKSLFASASLMLFIGLWDALPRPLLILTEMPLLASLLGGIFVGVGIGTIMRFGGSAGGDDTIALVLNHTLKLRIAYAYMITDGLVVLLSTSYIPISRLIMSMVTMLLSSLLIDYIQKPQNLSSISWLTVQPQIKSEHP